MCKNYHPAKGNPIAIEWLQHVSAFERDQYSKALVQNLCHFAFPNEPRRLAKLRFDICTEEIQGHASRCLLDMVHQNVVNFNTKVPVKPKKKPEWVMLTFTPCEQIFDNILAWKKCLVQLRQYGEEFLNTKEVDLRMEKDWILSKCKWAKTEDEKEMVCNVKALYEDCEGLFCEKCGSSIDAAKLAITRVQDDARGMLFDWESISNDKPDPDKIKIDFLKHPDHHKVPLYIGALDTCIKFLNKYKGCAEVVIGGVATSVPETSSQVKHQVAASGVLFSIYVTWYKPIGTVQKLNDFEKAKELYNQMEDVLLPPKIVTRLNNGIAKLKQEKVAQEAAAKAASAPPKKKRKSA